MLVLSGFRIREGFVIVLGYCVIYFVSWVVWFKRLNGFWNVWDRLGSCTEFVGGFLKVSNFVDF